MPEDPIAGNGGNAAASRNNSARGGRNCGGSADTGIPEAAEIIDRLPPLITLLISIRTRWFQPISRELEYVGYVRRLGRR